MEKAGRVVFVAPVTRPASASTIGWETHILSTMCRISLSILALAADLIASFGVVSNPGTSLSPKRLLMS